MKVPLPKFLPEDIDAIRKLLPPFEKEVWKDYINRAVNLGLMTLGEGVYLYETYGEWAINKEVIPWPVFLTA